MFELRSMHTLDALFVSQTCKSCKSASGRIRRPYFMTYTTTLNLLPHIEEGYCIFLDTCASIRRVSPKKL